MSGLFGGGSSGGKAPKAPALVQTNIPQTEAQALAADQQSYAMSDADYAARFPDLVAGRSYNVGNAASDMQGGTDPQVSGALKSAGFGDVNLGNTVFKQAQNLGQPILSQEQRGRNYFEQLLSDNPQRQFGLTGEDVANIALSNVGMQNSFNQGVYGTRVQAQNQQLLQNAQNQAAIYGAIGSLGSAGIRAYGASQYNSPTLNYGYYSPNMAAIYGGLSGAQDGMSYGQFMGGG